MGRGVMENWFRRDPGWFWGCEHRCCSLKQCLLLLLPLMLVVPLDGLAAGLTGTTVASPTSVNVSSEGSSDWVHWGLITAASVNRKSGVASQISNYTLLGSVAAKRFQAPAGARVAYSWTGGTPTASVTGTTTGLFFTGIGNGFRLTMPADTANRTLRLYAGGWKARGRLEASLSDGSGGVYSTIIDNPGGAIDRVVTLSFSAASAGQSLSVRYLLEDDYGVGNITLSSATLVVTLAAGLSGTTVASPTSVNLSSEGTGDWVHWGLSTAASVNRKSGVASQISNYTLLGSVAARRFQAPAGARVAYSWTGGTPTASVTGTTTGLFFTGIGNGFRLTVPVDTATKILRLYAGGWKARGRLEASLSDGSGGVYSTIIDNPGGAIDRAVTLSFSAASAGQSLSVRYLLEDDYGVGNITLSAATLVRMDSGGPVLPITYDFNSGNVSDWTVVQDTDRAPGWVGGGGAFVQSNRVESFNAFDGSYHKGTYAWLSGRSMPADYAFSVEALFQGVGLADDIGVMFRYQDNNNYYRFSMNSRYGFSRLEKKVGGIFSTLAVNQRGYSQGEVLLIGIEVTGARLRVNLNGEPLFAATDASLASGTVALYCQDRARFDNVVLEPIASLPLVAIQQPVAYSVVPGAGLSVTAQAANVPPGGSVAFMVDGGSAQVDSSAPYAASFNGLTQGSHTVEAVLRQSSGAEVGRDIRRMVGTGGDVYIALGDSITNGEGDFYKADNVSSSGRIIAFQGYEAVLSDLLESSQYPRPNVIANEGVGGDTSSLSLGRVASIIERHPGASHASVMLGTNDAGGSVPTSPSIFRTNMTELLQALAARGVTPHVALPPPAWGTESYRNARIEQYNAVIRDQLGLGVAGVGPDFYGYFLGGGENRRSLFSDNLHPNALGHAVMAQLWWENLTGGNADSFVLGSFTAATSAPYLQQNLLESGSAYYLNRAFTLRSIPAALAHGIWVMTANDDRASTSSTYLSFTVDRPVKVYVAYSSTAASRPNWMSSLGFIDTGMTVSVTDTVTPLFKVYSRSYAGGSMVALGGNSAQGASGAGSQYLVVVVPQ